MSRQNYNLLEEEVERGRLRWRKSKKPKMKISGAGVKDLQKIIKGKAKKK